MTEDQTRPELGLVLGSVIPPEDIRDLARAGESYGISEIWFAEDYFLTGGISSVTAALEATSTVKVGIGVVSAMVRHPAVFAMEAATLCRMYPGRFMPGIGLGAPAMINQMQLAPKSQLAAVREAITTTRRLLGGETVSADGGTFGFSDVTLAYPVDPVPEIYAGVTGPNMLRLSGEVADGTVASVLSGTAYVKWMRERIAEGQAKAGRSAPHRLAVHALFSCDEDEEKALDGLRGILGFYLSLFPKSPMSDIYGISDELIELAKGGPEVVAAGLDPQWVRDLGVAGTPQQCADRIKALKAAGADVVSLFPQPPDRSTEMVRLAGETILPMLG